MRSVVNTIKERLAHLSFRFLPRKKIFSDIYHGGFFGGDESVSGPGSNLVQTAVLRRELPSLLAELDVRRIIDSPCGDFKWMLAVDFGSIAYIGADIVEDLIDRNEKKYGSEERKFIVTDIVKDVLPLADLILCRDCFVHLSNRDVMRAIRCFKKSGSRYLLTTTFTALQKNVDMVTGRGWRPINLILPPFNFPPPIRLLNEKCFEQDGRYADKSLGLWLLKDI
jgi:hypothetical protein